MKQYRMVSERLGTVVNELDTLANWDRDIVATCNALGWPEPDLRECADGSFEDANTGEIVLEPVDEWMDM